MREISYEFRVPSGKSRGNLSIYLPIYLFIIVYLSISTFVSTSISTSIYIYICLSIYMFVYVCIHLYIHIHVSISTSTFISISTYIYIYIYTYNNRDGWVRCRNHPKICPQHHGLLHMIGHPPKKEMVFSEMMVSRQTAWRLVFPVSTTWMIWRFPEMRVSPSHPFIDGVFHDINHPALRVIGQSGGTSSQPLARRSSRSLEARRSHGSPRGYPQ